MLNADYLLFGLNAVSRAHFLNYFEDGYRGGAIISAVYLCKESPVEDGVPQVLGRLIDKHWTHTDLCAPSGRFTRQEGPGRSVPVPLAESPNEKRLKNGYGRFGLRAILSSHPQNPHISRQGSQAARR